MGKTTKGSDNLAASAPPSFWERFLAPVDIASLVYFRIAFGAIMLWEVWRYFSHNWISPVWMAPTFRFTYWGFDWIKPWPGDGLYLHFYALGLLSLLIILGLFYRFSTTLFFLGFTYCFLLEKTRYLNHFYLVCLISFLLIFVPAHRAFSLDALRRPSRRSDTAPAWALWLLRAQIGIVYFYGGVAKLNSDWLAGEPLRHWLATRTDFPLIGRYFTQ
ncbi:HTTM domain-containing protein, partial [Acidobacteria bacterium AH-259-L09]|nr:HTTM domain-containing protein [Acidobacteria bacterium AH-259-L09]